MEGGDTWDEDGASICSVRLSIVVCRREDGRPAVVVAAGCSIRLSIHSCSWRLKGGGTGNPEVAGGATRWASVATLRVLVVAGTVVAG